MFTALSSAWALLLGIAFIMLGNGLQGTLLGLRATIEGFSTGLTALVMTGYFAGFLIGSTSVPLLLKNVGHIRVFAALASLASGAVLLHTVFISPPAWFGFRLLTGFCYAGLYVIAESWLNDAASNETRGQLLSMYMVVLLGGMGAGQLLLNVADPASFELFILVSVLVSFSLVPITLSVAPAPQFEAPEHIGIRALYRASPLGVFGAFAVGTAHAAFFAMGAVYAQRIGMAVDATSYFMAAALAGGALLQWPIGRLSDSFDRRWIITLVTWIAAAVAIAAALTGERSPLALLLLTALFGGTSLPLYALFGAHTNDFLEPSQMVAASGTLVLVGGLGLTVGPGAAAIAMNLLGPAGLFWCLGGVHACIGLFALYRMTRRETRPVEEQRHYPAMPLRTSPVAAAAACQSVRDESAPEILHRHRQSGRVA